MQRRFTTLHKTSKDFHTKGKLMTTDAHRTQFASSFSFRKIGIFAENFGSICFENGRVTNDRDIHKHDMYKRNDNPLSPLKYKLAS